MHGIAFFNVINVYAFLKKRVWMFCLRVCLRLVVVEVWEQKMGMPWDWSFTDGWEPPYGF